MIKKGIIGLALVATLFSCGNSAENKGETTADGTAQAEANEPTAKGKIEFKDDVFNFGEVKEGAVIEHVYSFTNTGEAPIILSQVSASCGCTTPSHTQTPILPGKTGEVKVVFESEGQVGKQQKIITVVSNAENAITTVQMRGEVLEK